MKLTAKLMYDAITLNYVKNQGGEVLKDLNKILAEKDMTVEKMLNMSVANYMTNANEVMGTEQTGFGKEFVEETILSTELIQRLQTNGSLLAKATVRPMTGKSVDVPVQGAPLRMILSAEAVDAPTGGAADTAQVKKAGTLSINLTAKEMRITIYYSDTWLEDSVIGVAEYILNAITTAYDCSIHEILINGDIRTGATTNINAIVGNTTALPDGNKTDLLLADGARVLALENTGIVDALTNLDITQIRAARALMGPKGLNPNDLVMIPDTETYFELMNLTEVQTIEKFGDAATIKNGVLTHLDGIEIVNREEMGRALATGKQDITTPANNVLGAILIVHAPSVYVGIRRGLDTELSRYAEDKTTGVTGSARVAVTLNNEQNNKQPTLASAVIVNI